MKWIKAHPVWAAAIGLVLLTVFWPRLGPKKYSGQKITQSQADAMTDQQLLDFIAGGGVIQ